MADKLVDFTEVGIPEKYWDGNSGTTKQIRDYVKEQGWDCDICQDSFYKMKIDWRIEEHHIGNNHNTIHAPCTGANGTVGLLPPYVIQKGFFNVVKIYLCSWCSKIVRKEFIWGIQKKNKWDSVREIEAHSFTFDYINNNKDIIYNLAKNYYEELEEDRAAYYQEQLDKRDKLREKNEEKEASHKRYKKTLMKRIVKLLIDRDVKMPASDIDAFLKRKNVEQIKELCEQMYHNGIINRTSNYRYFILSEEKKKKKTKPAKIEKAEKVDIKSELKKFKEMLDDDLITQDDYDAKKKELLGL